ncbi:hypothetical protein D0962_04265 [Leptolyngbyaceae cyanobacterium CCMR0082]|uniref:Uncharacterized protein n=2 Tax=Adonisia TaxID=2950183 RepID=A0A6M0S0M4_9CYAN|nr:hypothetical protein [Adonisia turfae CCMR0082]
MRVVEDVLETNIATSYGLENRNIYTRIQRIETVEVIEGRLWWLLAVGVLLLPVYLLGIIPIVIFFLVKQKWLIVHNAGSNIILFYRDTKKAKDFCRTLMAVARKLNGKPPSPSIPKLPAQSSKPS